MRSITAIIKKTFIYTAVFVLASFSVLPSVSTVSADCDPTPPPDSSYGNGVHHPVGGDAGTFTYDCNTDTWSNQFYTYYPASNLRVANYSPNYSYDCNTGHWYMDEYDYASADGAYHLSRVVAPDPGFPTGCSDPDPPADSDPASDGSESGGGSSGINNTGAGSNNSTNNNANLNGSTTNNNQLSMNNVLFSNATTGNTFVIANTHAGNATSGDAQSIANIANLLQSSSNAFGSDAITFTANIDGDVNGDFMFDPSALISDTGQGSNNTANNNLQVNTNSDNNTSAQINNTIDIGANSGNATVSDNTNAGGATSGNAKAIVNLMNLINSTVSSGHSFIGTVNINGNLNGDILLPQDFIDELLANTGAGSNNIANTNLTDNSQTTNNTIQGIANHITTSANSGNANVSGNTNAGNATTGSANTGVTILNLTGSKVVGKNDLLVFVNVLGRWVGMIVNAPAGSRAASLGGGITNTGAGSNNATNTNITDNSHTTNSTTEGITNNINAHSQTGDASVTNNTNAGNARSGDASTAVNILNLEGSNLDLSNWFGVLFINVFGNWTGSFGVNTSAGDPINNPTFNPVQAANEQAMADTVKQFASFFPTSSSSSTGGDSTNQETATLASVLGSSTSVAKKLATSALPTADNGTHASFTLPIIGMLLAVALLLMGDRRRLFGSKKAN